MLKPTLIFLAVLSTGLLAYRAASVHYLAPAVRRKERLLRAELQRRGLRDQYLIISGYRPAWYNALLPLSAPKSSHLRGLTIDILVGDVNRDGRMDSLDVRQTVQVLLDLDRRHPELRGGIGTYRSSPRMVHFDASGSKRRWVK